MNLLRRNGLFALIGMALLFGGSSIASNTFPQGGGFVIFGRVRLPDGRPAAARMKVFIEATNGLRRDTLSDDQGNYEFRGMNGGRYRVYATNPDAPEQYCDPIEADTTRSYSNRLQVDINLKLPLHKEKKDVNPGIVSAAEAAQNIPKPALKAYEQGLKLQKEDKGEQALTAFNQAIELYPEYFQALTERANLLMGRSKLTEAAADFERALRLNDKYSPALRGLGYCQIQQKQFEVAASNLERAFVIEPKVPLTLLLLGYANLSLGRYEPAKQCLQEALKLGPESAARAYVYLADVFAHEQKFKEAADSIRRYLTLKPDAADATDLRKMESDWRARGKAVKDQK
ncbi:MAG TPA: tetratricopeptide repeat protein [Blastocatellia bacterium]|jgi:tetratricopeptide (TPR) repeat protein|nr:tetratricopeptide repeat protein [Blastocatellia bacterium]